jgi:hypothetical protein
MEMLLLLIRICSGEAGTFGVLKWSHELAPFALTLEDPWRNNTPFVSCIPSGHYVCKPIRSPAHGPTFEVQDVENRTHILFHKGNTHVDTQGCVLIGEQYEFLDGIPSVNSSRKGYTEWWETAKLLEEFMLEISWVNLPA